MSRYQHSNPYKEGYDAFWQDYSENPYSAGSDNAELWDYGHQHAEDDYWEEVEYGDTLVGEF